MKKRVIISTFILLLFLYLAWQFNRITERPSFCNSCHFMKPFVANWETSSHNTVRCSACHWGPGFSDLLNGKLRLVSEMLRYSLGAYNPQVRSKVKDEACQACHKESDIPDTTFYLQKIPFMHKTHYGDTLRGIKTTCTTCHYELVQGKHIAVTNEPCIECHFVGTGRGQPVKNCYTCHGPPRDEILIDGMVFNHSEYLKTGVSCSTCHIHVTSGRGDVPRKACRTCHVERFKVFTQTEKIHTIHVTEEKQKCIDCHSVVKHGKIEVNPSITPDCKVCHGPGHSIQEEMYIGIGAKNVATLPDPMFTANVACYGCHLPLSEIAQPVLSPEPKLPKASGESCKNCHGKGYDRLLTMWQKSVKQRLVSVDSTLRFLKPFQNKTRSVSKLFKEISQNLEIVKKDGSLGAHNIRYTLTILDSIEVKLSRVVKILGGTDLKKYKEAQTVPSPCRNCHPGINYRTVLVKYRNFPHKAHTQKYTCQSCHSKKVHGKTLKTDCEACHHGKPDIEERCKDCHQTQVSLYRGTLMGLNSPDVMADAEVTCADCHINDTYPEKPDPETCINCHEEGYDETLQEWQTQTKTGLELLKLQLDSLYQSLADKKGNDFKKSFQRYEEGLKLLAILRKDGSLGAHNNQLVEDLLRSWKKE